MASGGLDTWKLGFGFRKYHGKMGLRQVEKGSIAFFCQIFGIFDNSSKWNFEKSSNTYAKNLAKNEDKHCSTCLKA